MLANPHVQLNLIILDLNIPKITGLALLEQWRGRATPIVVFSSTASPEEKERSLALGVREFVSKPKDLEEFSETIGRIVERWAMPAGG